MAVRRGIILTLFSCLTAMIYSQDKDFGIWYNASVEHEFTKKLEIDLLTTIRTFENASKIEESFIEGEITYKFTNFISAAASYRITDNIEDDNSYHLRHKWFVGLKGKFEIWNIEISGRTKYQERYKTYFEDEEDKIPDSHFRFKLTASFKTPSFPVNPYISAELFCPVFKESDIIVDKKRIAGGIEYKISKRHSVEAEYIYQRDYKPKLAYDHIISLNYKFKL